MEAAARVEEEARGTNMIRIQSRDLARNADVLQKEVNEEEKSREKAAEVIFVTGYWKHLNVTHKCYP